MAEVGLLPFARVALEVSRAVLPCYRTRFSKHQFTQPQLHRVRRKRRRRARVAVDATGLAQGAVSTYFVRRLHHHGQKPLPWRHWLKWVIVADLDRQFLLSQTARRGPWNDCGNLPAVVGEASQRVHIGLVLADAEFDSERNPTYIRKQLGAQSVIPAKHGKKTWRLHGVRAEMRRGFHNSSTVADP